MRIFWALVLILFGIGYLGAGLNWWGYDVVGSLWQFWPLVLIFWGLDLMTKKTTFYLPVMIIALILSGAFIYTFLYSQQNQLPWMGRDWKQEETITSEFSETIPDGVKTSEVSVNAGAVDFTIEGKTTELFAGDLVSSFAKPTITVEEIGEKASSVISTSTQTRRRMWNMMDRGFQNKLTLALNDTLLTNLRVKSGASNLNLDLTDYVLSGLEVEAGASSARIKIGEKIQNGSVISLDMGASAISVEFPKSIGVKITTDTGLTDKDFVGYTEKSGAYYSPGYDTAKVRVQLQIKAGASSVEVK